MAYLPYTYVPIGSSGTERTRVALPYGGVSLTDGDGVTQDGKCKSLVNIEPKNGRIETRHPQSTHLYGFTAEGTLNGSTRVPYFDNLVFHVGTRLYILNDSLEAPQSVGEGLPDKKSLMCDFMAKLYIYCDGRIFSLDKNLVFKEEEPTPVLLYSGCSPQSGTGARTLTPINVLSPRITVRFTASTLQYYNLPTPLDTTRPYQVYINDKPCVRCTVEEELISLPSPFGVSDEAVLSVTYYMKNPEEEGYDGAIEGCNLVCDYGGNATGGTRLFFTGNPDKPGVYYKGEFQDPLYCAADSFETIGDGSRSITAIIKMYGNLIIFTEGSVYRMSYTLTEDGAFFSTKQISDYVGCDCPGSLQVIDNRAVFLNSERGVFIVDSTDEAGEHNIKPLSGNVLKGDGLGILDLDGESLKNAASCDFDRKYMLFAGGRAFVWDYDKTPFSESSGYSKAQERLCWYIYDGVEGKSFYPLGTRLISISSEAEGAWVNEFDASAQSAPELESVFESGNIAAFSDGKRRFVTGMGIKLSRSESCSLAVTFLADGREYFSKSIHKRSSPKEKIYFSLPRKALYDFGFKISGVDRYAIDSIEIFSREISE